MVDDRPVRLRGRSGHAAVAAGATVVPVVEMLVDSGSRPRSLGAAALIVVLLTAAGASLLLRTRAPALVTCVSGAAALGCVAAGDRSPLVACALGVTLYSVGAAEISLRPVLLVAAVAGAVLIVGRILESDRPLWGHDLAHVTAVVTPVIVGRLVAVQRLAAVLRTERVALARQAEQDAQELRVEQERRRIARDLHDVVGHALTTITVQAGVAARLLDTRPEFARQALQEISAAGGEALRDLRGVVGMLRGSVDDAADREPSLDDVPALVDRVRAMGVRAVLVVTGPSGEVPRSTQVAVYRIVQEALTNVRRHAGAQAPAEVSITVEDGGIAVAVRNAAGVGVAPRVPVEGAGLIGMRERVAAADGELEVGPTPDGGFAVRARLPLPAGVRPGVRS